MLSPKEDKEKDKDKDKDLEKQEISGSIIDAVNKLSAAWARLDRVENQLNSGSTAQKSSHSKIPTVVKEYDDLLSSYVSPMLEASLLLNESTVQELADLIYSLLSAIRSYLLLSFQYKKPQDDEYLLHPIQELTHELSVFADKHKNSPNADLLNVISKSSPIFSWITSPNPSQHLNQNRGNFDTALAKVTKDIKLRQEQFGMIDNLSSYFKNLDQYLIKNFTNGVLWNPTTGRDAPPKLQLQFQTRGTYNSRILPNQFKSTTDGNKMYCDHINGDKQIELENDKKSLFILRAFNAKITIKGKPAALVLDGSSYCCITLADGVGSVSVIGSDNIDIQSQLGASSLSFERTHKCNFYFSHDGTPLELNVTGSSEIFLIDGEDKIEIPSSSKVRIKQGKIQTAIKNV